MLAGEGGNWRDLVDILDRKDSGQEIRGNGGGKSQLRARDRLGVVSVDGRERQPLPHQGKPQNGERTLYDSKMVGRKRDQRRVVGVGVGVGGLLAGEGGNWRDLVDILDRKDSGQEIRGNGGGKSQLRARDRLGVVSVGLGLGLGLGWGWGWVGVGLGWG